VFTGVKDGGMTVNVAENTVTVTVVVTVAVNMAIIVDSVQKFRSGILFLGSGFIASGTFPTVFLHWHKEIFILANCLSESRH